MTATGKVPARDLEADLAICESATTGPWSLLEINVARFIVEAREGWPCAIRRALEAEAEIDRLRNELNILQEQLEVCGVDASTC